MKDVYEHHAQPSFSSTKHSDRATDGLDWGYLDTLRLSSIRTQERYKKAVADDGRRQVETVDGRDGGHSSHGDEGATRGRREAYDG